MSKKRLKIVRKKELLDRCGFSNSTLYEMIKRGEFPKPRKLSPSGRAVGWLSTEIDAYLESLEEA